MERYFRPIARITPRGNDEYALVPINDPEAPAKCDANSLEARITARKSGRLYLYVNDAVLFLPGLSDYFYKNNHGTAKVTVE